SLRSLVKRVMSSLPDARTPRCSSSLSGLGMTIGLLCAGVIVQALAGCVHDTTRAHNANSHLVLGDMLRAKGDIPGAVAEYREALQISPETANAYYALGRALHNQGRVDEAIQRYRQALVREPYIDPRTHDFFRHPFPIPRFHAL